MESGINKKRLKIVWLCHFANQEMKEYFNRPRVNEFAPWINGLICLFKGRSEIELHIVSPNVFTNKDCSFTKDGITYHFYKHIPFPFYNKFIKKVYNKLDFDNSTNHFWIKHKINNIITKINPDVIHLHGAEIPYYSAGILHLINRYPTLTTIQGFIKNASQVNRKNKKKAEIEKEILLKSMNIGVRTDEMSSIALQMNPNARQYFHNYPLNTPNNIKDNIGVNEPIDCVFFARICKDKGVEDLLAAIAIVKREYPQVSLSIIGGTSKSYLSYLKNKCVDLHITDNVKFLGFLPTQADIYQYALNAKMCVLPTYHDIIPGTIIESMFMKLPVIAYSVGGIPELNIKEETIMLVEKLDIEMLAEKILLLIDNVELRKSLAEKAFFHAKERFDNTKIPDDLLNAYYSILKQQ